MVFIIIFFVYFLAMRTLTEWVRSKPNSSARRQVADIFATTVRVAILGWLLLMVPGLRDRFAGAYQNVLEYRVSDAARTEGADF